MIHDAALVFHEQFQDDGPTTHVLVVGLGTYDYLLDGTSQNAEMAGGMGQIPSAANSARSMAGWFLDHYDNPDRPLASLAIVLSEPAPARFAHPRCNQVPADLPNGTVETIADAMAALIDRASATPNCMIILYLAGHGLQAVRPQLLCRDYGHRWIQRFDRSIDLEGLLAALATMAPSDQLVLLDTCRVPDRVANLAMNRDASNGRPLLSPVDARAQGRGPARQSVHFATSPFSEAWAEIDGLSLYCRALLSAFHGGGAQGGRFEWWVTASGLQDAVAAYVPRDADGRGLQQDPDRVRGCNFKLCRPTTSDVPVYVSCEPGEVWQLGFRLRAQGRVKTYEYENDPKMTSRPTEWTVSLPRSSYVFDATFARDSIFEDVAREDVLVLPPMTPVRLSMRRRDV